jgi:hypothetical protein
MGPEVSVGTAPVEGVGPPAPGSFHPGTPTIEDAPRVGSPDGTEKPSGGGGGSGAGTRRVRLTVSRVDPWSVLKLSFLLSVALGIGLVTATIILWVMINAMGVFGGINEMLQNVDADGNVTFNIYDYFGLGRVISLATFIGVINVIIIMALSTLGAYLYNTAASLVGGLHITLSDD